MQGTVPVTGMTVYASGSEYLDGPTPSEQAAGMVPLDTVPADWWNMMFQNLTTQLNNTVTAFNQIYSELLYVITSTGGTPSEADTTQLYQALNSLRQTSIGTAAAAGSVKSSATSGKVSIDANGIMTPNDMGTPTSLNTTSKIIVGAINELKTTIENLDSTLRGLITSAEGRCAPTSHASSATTYGAGDDTNYGHVKLSDSTSSTSGEADGVAATPTAVKDAYDLANGKAAVGNTAGADLAAAASAGSSSAAARADHVHQFPTLVSNNGTRCKVDFVLNGTTLNITTTNV